MDGTWCGSSGSECVEVARDVEERVALEYGGAHAVGAGCAAVDARRRQLGLAACKRAAV